MSLYSHSFNLLSPPPRNAYSWGEESTRAKLPNFDNVNELSEFIHRLFIFRFQVINITLQIKIGCACLGFLIVICTLIIARRMYERNFWVFRFVKTPSGMIIVPNTMLSFIVIESGFVVVLIALILEVRNFYDKNTDKPNNILLWWLLPWCILIFGPFFAALGTHYATPKTLNNMSKQNQGGFKARIKAILSNAVLANILAILIPCFTCVTVAVPSFIANAKYMRAKRRQEEWQIHYKSEIDFTQEMVIEAQFTWFEALSGMKFMSITYSIWFFWAIFCFFLYTSLSLRLVRAIYKEVKKTKREEMLFIATKTERTISQHHSKFKSKRMNKNEGMRENIGEEVEMNIRQQSRLPNIIEDDAKENEIREIATMQHGLQSAINFDAYQLDTNEYSYVAHDSNLRLGYPNSLQDKRNLRSQSSIRLDKKTASQEDRNTAGLKIRLPNLVISQKKLDKRTKESMLASMDELKKELRKAAFNIIAQCLAISPGCALMGGIALMLALTCYGSFEQPSKDGLGTYFERFMGIAVLFVIYTIIVLGSGCFVCVLFRVYEPIFVKSGNSSKETECRETMLDKTNEEEQ